MLEKKKSKASTERNYWEEEDTEPTKPALDLLSILSHTLFFGGRSPGSLCLHSGDLPEESFC